MESKCQSAQERPELLTYRLVVQPSKEWPGFRMMCFPWRLAVLMESAVISPEEGAQAHYVFAAMFLQVLDDMDPSRGYEDIPEDNDIWVWQGTVERVCRRMRDVGWQRQEVVHGKPLPDHVHGDGVCEMQEFEGEQTCMKESRDEAEEHRATCIREAEEMMEPAWVEKQVALLERYGLIVRLKDPQFLEGLKEGLNLNLKGSKVKEGKECKENLNNHTLKVKGDGKGGTQHHKTFLQEETKTILIDAGIDHDWIRYMDALPGYAKVLNNPFSGVPADAVRILNKWMRDTTKGEQFAQWLRQHPAPANMKVNRP